MSEVLDGGRSTDEVYFSLRELRSLRADLDQEDYDTVLAVLEVRARQRLAQIAAEDIVRARIEFQDRG